MKRWRQTVQLLRDDEVTEAHGRDKVMWVIDSICWDGLPYARSAVVPGHIMAEFALDCAERCLQRERARGRALPIHEEALRLKRLHMAGSADFLRDDSVRDRLEELRGEMTRMERFIQQVGTPNRLATRCAFAAVRQVIRMDPNPQYMNQSRIREAYRANLRGGFMVRGHQMERRSEDTIMAHHLADLIELYAELRERLVGLLFDRSGWMRSKITKRILEEWEEPLFGD